MTKEYNLPLIPLRNMVAFPELIFPFLVGRPKSLMALNNVSKQGSLIFLSVQKKGELEEPAAQEIEKVGVIAKIVKEKRDFDNTVKLLVQVVERGKILRFTQKEPFFKVKAIAYPYEKKQLKPILAISKEIVKSFENLLRLSDNSPIGEDLLEKIHLLHNPTQIAMNIAFQLKISFEEKQKLLEYNDLYQMFQKLLVHVNNEYEIAKLQSKIRAKVKNNLDNAQKRIILSQELDAIKSELNKLDGQKNEIDELREKIKKAHLAKEANEHAIEEINKLEYTPNYSPEYTVILNYLDWLTSIPWYNKSKENENIKKAWQILDKSHWGLEKIKERIIEILAVRHLAKGKKGPVICFVGPPGVGKTSLGKAIASAMGRTFVRISLGGVRDEAEIRGHRKTYIGSLPGKIIQTMKRAKVVNPVFLMDEIDKMASDFRGDPASAMLEVLDPEQNFMFIDHYLEVSYDLSQVFFITTANNIYDIPDPLRDRMEIINLSGYTSLEKFYIAKYFLIPRQLKENGLKKTQVKFNKTGLMEIIEHFTMEAGVRNLERQIGKVCRKIAKSIVLGDNKKIKFPINVNKEQVHKFLGLQEYRISHIKKKNQIGVVNGLAWTQYGGVYLSIETLLIAGKGKIIITGQIGKVMQESAQIALSLIKSNYKKLGIKKEIFEKNDIHIHVPEGAIPKDGPSAGITIATSLLSALSKKKVSWDCAMTGELTLKGDVLPIGGLKEKLLAAHKEGIKKVFIPIDNKNTLEEVPIEIKTKLSINFATNIWDVWKKVFNIDE